MKTAISLPDDIYAAASSRALEMGISRSAFLAAAAVDYLEKLDRASLTQRIDLAVSAVESDDSTQDAAALGRTFLQGGAAEDW